jgi:hypothetical protein
MKSRGGARPSSLVVAKDHVILAQCEGVVMARLERLVPPSPEAHPPEGLHIARALVRDRREAPVRVLNATRRDQS